jgi:hypothetical protein
LPICKRRFNPGWPLQKCECRLVARLGPSKAGTGVRCASLAPNLLIASRVSRRMFQTPRFNCRRAGCSVGPHKPSRPVQLGGLPPLGLIAQRESACFARRGWGFDSPSVHQRKSERKGIALAWKASSLDAPPVCRFDSCLFRQSPHSSVGKHAADNRATRVRFSLGRPKPPPAEGRRPSKPADERSTRSGGKIRLPWRNG